MYFMTSFRLLCAAACTNWRAVWFPWYKVSINTSLIRESRCSHITLPLIRAEKWLYRGIAIIGVFFKLAFAHRFEAFSLISYLTMGWLSLIVIYQLALKLSTGGIVLLAIGGVIYSLGVIFYASKRIPFAHAIWHGFVLGGCACHFMAIYFYVR